MKSFYVFFIVAIIGAATITSALAADAFTGGFNSPSYSAFNDPATTNNKPSLHNTTDNRHDGMGGAATRMGAVEPAAGGDETITAKPANDNDADNAVSGPTKMHAKDSMAK